MASCRTIDAGTSATASRIHLQDILHLGVGEIAPDLPGAQGSGIAPATAPARLFAVGAAQPGTRRQRREQRGQGRGLLREHGVQCRAGQAFLLIQTRQDLLHQDARQVSGLPCFHHALLRQLIQRQKLQQLLSGPRATTDTPEVV